MCFLRTVSFFKVENYYSTSNSTWTNWTYPILLCILLQTFIHNYSPLWTVWKILGFQFWPYVIESTWGIVVATFKTMLSVFLENFDIFSKFQSAVISVAQVILWEAVFLLSESLWNKKQTNYFLGSDYTVLVVVIGNLY